jgi:hypothetical protein
MDEHMLRVFENRVLRIFGPKMAWVMGNGKKYITRSLKMCTTHQIFFG